MTAEVSGWKNQFASDNTSAICPEAWDAMKRANEEISYAIGYGDDPITRKAEALIRDLFETDCDVFFVFNGSAANSLALSTMTNPYGGIICHPFAHVETDEANAPEFFTGGAKLILVDGPLGKIDPADIPPLLRRGHDIHSAKLQAVTITQATEVGTLYTPDEIRAMTDVRRHDGLQNLRFHMDGARFANAVAAFSGKYSPADLTWRSGIDALSFGGAKNGMPASEALVFFDKKLANNFAWTRKRGGQLASKMRYQAAPWIGMIETGAWLENGRRANAAADKLAKSLSAIEGVEIRFPVEANGVFASLPDGVAEAVAEQGWHFYYFEAADAWRFMCCWSTSDNAIDALAADIHAAVAEQRS